VTSPWTSAATSSPTSTWTSSDKRSCLMRWMSDCDPCCTRGGARAWCESWTPWTPCSSSSAATSTCTRHIVASRQWYRRRRTCRPDPLAEGPNPVASRKEQRPRALGDDDPEPSVRSRHQRRKRTPRMSTQSSRRRWPRAPDLETSMTKARDDVPTGVVDLVTGRPDPSTEPGDEMSEADGGRLDTGIERRPWRRT
jgi:hypothetical protein